MWVEIKNINEIKAKLSYRRLLILMYEGVEKGENNFEKIMLVNLRLKNVTLKVE